MASLKHTCDNCESEFTIRYDEENTESDPSFCPFCAEMIVDVDKLDEEEE